MAFPAIAASNSSVQATNATSHTISLPSSIASGNLLFAAIVADSRPTLSGTLVDDWTFLIANSPNNDAMRLYVYFKNATGSEGSTVGFTTNVAQCTAHRTYRLTGQHESTNPFATSENSENSILTTIDPPVTNPSTWDVEDALWIVFAGNDDGTTTVTTFPTSYINTGQLAGGNQADGVNIAWCTRENAVASEDPSTITFSAIEGTAVAVIAIRPSATIPPITPAAITASATLFEPLVQNMTLQPSVISAAAVFIGHEPNVLSVTLPPVITAAATAQQPTVVNLGTTQNLNPTVINAEVTMNSLIGVFLVGPISPPAISITTTFNQPFVGTNIVPATISVATTLYSPTMNLEIQYLNPDRIVVGMFVFSPDVIGSFGTAGLRATVIDLPKNASVSDPDFQTSVSDTAKTAILQESYTVTLRD